MSGYSCLIFDDEPSAIVEISFLIGKYAPDWKITGVASTVHDCKKLLREHSPDVIFTDIHFGEDNIFDIVSELRQYKGDIIFVSGDNGFASQAFQLSAVNYFLKPVNNQEFKTFIEKYSVEFSPKKNESFTDVLFHNLKEDKSATKKIAFNTNSGYIVRELKEVVYAKASSNYTEFYFSNGEKFIQPRTLMIYEKMLEDMLFFRIHQSFLVNLAFISRFDKESLLLHLTTEEVLPVSVRRKAAFLDVLNGIF